MSEVIRDVPQQIARARAEAVVLQAIFFARAIADLAIGYRLPSASVLRSYPHAGGLISLVPPRMSVILL